MGRNIKLRTALRQQLRSMAAFGQSKHRHKLYTQDERAELKQTMLTMGFTQESIDKAVSETDTAKYKIFSFGTMETYQKQVAYFADYVAEHTGTERTSMEDAEQYIQPFINAQAKKGLSPCTINTRLSAITKATGLYNKDFEHPERHYAECRRGLAPALNDEKNSRNHAVILDANTIIGVRRKELEEIRLEDIRTTDKGHLEIHTIGKGGKHNINHITKQTELDVIQGYIKQAQTEHRDTLFTKEQLKNDCDLHSCRADRAKNYYNQIIEEMRAEPDRREYYKEYINSALQERGRKTLTDKQFERDYRCRSYNKALLEERGAATQFNRVAVLMVSIDVTNHYRCDTTVQHYLAK